MTSGFEGIARNLLIVGGRFEADNAALFDHMRDQGGKRMAVITAASNHPYEVQADIVAAGARHNIESLPLRLSVEDPQSAFDEKDIATLRNAGHVYFSGGDQSRIMKALRPNGSDSPMLQAIRDIAAKGGMIAGSSAGAAIMSHPMIADGDPADAMVVGVPGPGGVELADGLGFLADSLVDQHFLARGRAGRLMTALHGQPHILGIGIDENTGLAVQGNQLKVIGESRVCIIRWLGQDQTDDHFDIEIFRDGAVCDLGVLSSREPVRPPTGVKEEYRPFDPFDGEDQIRLFSEARKLDGRVMRMIWDDPDGLVEIRMRLAWAGAGILPSSHRYHMSVRRIS